MGIGALSDQQWQVGHLADRDAVQHHALGIDQGQPILILPQGRRLPFHDVDDQRIRESARYARILDPAIFQQPLADCRHV